MFKKVVFILMLIQLLGLLSACYFENWSIKWIDFELLQLDFRQNPAQISSNDSISYQNFGLQLNLLDTIFPMIGLKTGLMPAAYGLQYAQRFHPFNSANRIQITTLTDLGNGFPALSVVSDLFRSENLATSIDVALQKMNEQFNASKIKPILTLRFNPPFAVKRMCQFRVEVLLSDSTVLKHDTELLKLF